MITKKTIFADYVKIMEGTDACQAAKDWCMSENIKYPNCTFEQVMTDVLAAKPEIWPEGWAVWNLVVLGDRFDAEMRSLILQKIKDPMAAFKIYEKVADLTDEEDLALKVVFENKLPVSEKKLVDGELIREKDKISE